MAKPAVLFLASALCFLSLLGSAFGTLFNVQGQVYCDTCRAQFLTRASQYLEGAKVKLECRNETTEIVTLAMEAVTDKTGTYNINVDKDYGDDICEIALVESNKPDCNEINHDGYFGPSARISLTSKNGIISPLRQANPLGFMKKDPLPECGEIFKELGIIPKQTVIQP